MDVRRPGTPASATAPTVGEHAPDPAATARAPTGAAAAASPSAVAAAAAAVAAGASGSGTASGAPVFGTGARIGRYVILERVGSGAMGVVYGAYDPELDRKIALKVLKPQGAGQGPTAPARLLREAKAMARLAHPNVISVHDVGIFQEQVFLAMEFLAGGTLHSWLSAEPGKFRPVDQIREVFIAAGRGLAAAHAAGLVHRDFKPDNVLLDREGRPRVVDFGLARDANANEDVIPTKRAAAQPLPEESAAGGHLQTLTRTGALMGTPAYMAPEQFLGEATDERTDQFSFCVALYEALYGERPFSGDTMLALSLSVTEGQLRPLPKYRDVPTWIRRVLMRGLSTKPADRFPSMAALIAALENDPAAKRRRRLLVGGGVAALAAGILVVQQALHRRRAELERRISAQVGEGTQAAEGARARAKEVQALRARAYAAFDNMDADQGEALWHDVLGKVPPVQAAYDRSERAFETALVLDADRKEIRDRLGDVRAEHLRVAEELRLDRETPVLAARLAADDADGSRRRALAAPASLVVKATPVTASVMLERYDREPAAGRRALTPVGPLSVGAAPFALPAGSYRVALRAPGYAEVLYPFEVERGQARVVELAMPQAAAVPDGYVYVAPGESWFGDGDELLRTQFLGTVPIHRRHTDGYLIARRETTWSEWIAFLDAQPADARAKLAPDVTTALRGSVRLKEVEGSWQLSFQPTTSRYVARSGEPIVYNERRTRARQQWLRMPLAGTSPEDAEQYLGWLRTTGRLPGARLCTEVEWERAARGADDRLFPHGDDLRPEDANFDLTYGRKDPAYGPDEVGTYPGSRSPFGADDLAGNLYELVRSSVKPNELVVRGGGYYFSSINSRVTNRQVVPAMFRDMTAGVRVCASVPGGNR